MTEIRPIRPAESDDFLRLLCRVFELDFERAKSVFYHEPLFELDRKWALIQDGEIRSILTSVPLEFGWGRAFGVAGVATAPEHRRKGLAADLLTEVVAMSKDAGESACYLFARDPRVYERIGFSILDDVITAPIATAETQDVLELLSTDEVRAQYDAWAKLAPNRLRRDERRWTYWGWNLRMCTRMGSGYVCVEGDTVREVVGAPLCPTWPMTGDATWSGLRSVASSANVPIGEATHVMNFMGIGGEGVPEMFLTDQF